MNQINVASRPCERSEAIRKKDIPEHRASSTVREAHNALDCFALIVMAGA
jgi:hypothetical protein